MNYLRGLPMSFRILTAAVALISVVAFAGPVAEQKARLTAEIAAIEAKGGVGSPAFEAELHEWEAKMAQHPEALPTNITATLALEPTERSPEQRRELAVFFRPRSKVYAAVAKEIAAKRAQLAKLK